LVDFATKQYVTTCFAAMNFSQLIVDSEEVLYSRGESISMNRFDVDQLRLRAAKTQRQRVRLCTHPDTSDLLHEMMIVHGRGAYVRPHKHPGKSESVHIIEGLADVVMFDELGDVTDVVKLGSYKTGEQFYFRMNKTVFHTLIIRSEVLVFHEITNGPFDRSRTEFAEWAPDGLNPMVTADFIANLECKISSHRSSNE
jgi:cupin fold WbuC family metalloprotein